MSTLSMKKLYRSNENKIIAGVLGGIAEYLETDPVILRLIFVLLTCFTGFIPGLVFYFVSLLIVPKKPIGFTTQKTETPPQPSEAENTEPTESPEPSEASVEDN